MEKICLDSDVALDFLCGERATVEKLRYYADNEQVCTHPLIALELAAAIRKPAVLDSFLASVMILPIDKNTVQVAAGLAQDMREKGLRSSFSTLLTAAVCISNNAFLFTNDRAKFDGITKLRRV